MTKKLFAILLTIAMLATIVVVPVSAADEVVCNFNDANQWAEGTVSGVAGKSADDKSLANQLDKYSIIQLNEITTFEFSFYNSRNWVNFLAVSWSGLSSTMLLGTDQDNIKFKILSDKATRIPSYQWSRIAVTIDPTTSENNITLYVNGTNAGTASITKPNSSTATLRTNFTPGTHYIDDFIAYHGTYTATELPTLSSTSNFVIVDETSKTVKLPNCSVEYAASKLSASGGEFAGVVDATTHLTKTEGNIQEGDKIAAVSSDGKVYSYYTVALLPDKNYSQDFTDVTAITGAIDDKASLNIPSGASATYVSSVGGKNSSDRSLTVVHSASANNTYLKIPGAYSGRTTIEYSILKTDEASSVRVDDATQGDKYKFPYLRYSAQIQSSTLAAGTYSAGQWVRVVYDINIDDASCTDPAVGQYNVYIDGVKKASRQIETAVYNMKEAQMGVSFSFLKSADITSTTYLDDISIHSNGYTAITSPALVAKNGASLSGAVVKIPEIDASKISDYFDVSNGTIAGVVNGTSYLTKSTGIVSEGDKLAVLADDGLIYKYYNIEFLKSESYFNSYEDDANGVCGVGGKISTDKSSEAFTTENQHYAYNGKKDSYGITTYEYSLLLTDNKVADHFRPYVKNSSGDITTYNMVGYIGIEDKNSKIAFKSSYDTETKKYDYFEPVLKIGQWNRIAWEMHFSDGSTTPTCTLFVNGVELGTSEVNESIANGAYIQIRLIQAGHIDDFKVYPGSYKGANSEMPTLSSGAGYTVNEDTKVAFLENAVAVADAASVFGSNATVVDPKTHLTKTEGNVETGDLIAVVSEDGLFFNYYTAVIETISNIEILNGETPINTDLVQAGSLTAKVHITAAENASYKLYIAKYEGNTLTAVSVKDITIAPEDGSYVDADFATEAVEVTNASSENIKAFLWKTDSQSPIKYKNLLTEASSSVF